MSFFVSLCLKGEIKLDVCKKEALDLPCPKPCPSVVLIQLVPMLSLEGLSPQREIWEEAFNEWVPQVHDECGIGL